MRNLPYSKAFDANGNSDVIDIRLAFAISMQTVSGAATTGTVKLQVSNANVDQPSSVPSGSWVDLPSGSITVTAATTQLMAKTDICYNWARVNLASLSGSNGITVYIKGLGQ